MHLQAMKDADRMAKEAAQQGVAVTVPFLLGLLSGAEMTTRDCAPCNPYPENREAERDFCSGLRFAARDAAVREARTKAVFQDLFGRSRTHTKGTIHHGA